MSEKQLSWQLGFSLSRKPAKRPAPRRNAQQGFEFVIEEPQLSHRYRRARRSPTETARVHLAGPLSSSPSRESGHSIVADADADADAHQTHSPGNEAIQEDDDEPPLDTDPSSLELELLGDDSSTSTEASPDPNPFDGTNKAHADASSCQTEGQSTAFSHVAEPTSAGDRNDYTDIDDLDEPNTTALTTLTVAPYYFDFLPVPNTMEYNSLTDRFRPILSRCTASPLPGPPFAPSPSIF